MRNRPESAQIRQTVKILHSRDKSWSRAGSFEYNNVEFEDKFLLTPRMAMSDLNEQICNCLAQNQWHSNKQNMLVYVSTLFSDTPTYIFPILVIFSPAY